MEERDTQNVLEKVRRALGRGNASPQPPTPPALTESIIRLVPRDADLVEWFIKAAKEQKMLAARFGGDRIVDSIIVFLRENQIRRVALSLSPVLERFRLFEALAAAGFDARRWDQISLDEMYDFDCAVTGVQCAVAENATLVIKPSASQGRSMSLVPMFHVAVVEASQILPDMMDLFERLARETDRSNVIFITGPSKTADIEMNVVTGVHGPNVVNVFVVD